MVAFLYYFGFCQEDERTQAAATHVENGNVLCIASAGDLPLSLLALGARSVTAVDISGPQLHLCQLKSAAIRCLKRRDAVGLLGFVPAAVDERRHWLAECLPFMPSEAAQFWNVHTAELCRRGAIWCGRQERFLCKLRAVLRPALGRAFEELVRCTDCRSQEEIFEKRINRPWLRRVFRLAFDPRVFSGRGMDPKSLAHRQSPVPLGDQYWAMLRAFCTRTPAAANPWLQLFTTGRLVSTDAAPAYLTPAGFENARAALERLRWLQSDLLVFLDGVAMADFAKVPLSNLPDWLTKDQFEKLITGLACKLSPGSRLVWCFLHVDRALPSTCPHPVLISEDLGDRLREQDRFPFYHIVPAYIP